MKKLFAALKSKLVKIKNNLSRVNDRETLSVFSIVVLVFLDIFILIAIFRGLDEHTRQLTTPEEYVPAVCREIILDDEWGESGKLDRLSGLLLPGSDYYEREEEEEAGSLHPVCATCVGSIKKMRKDRELVSLFKTRNRVRDEYSDLKGSIEDLKGSYDTYLLQVIAGQSKSDAADVNRIRQELQVKTARFNAVVAQLGQAESRINESAGVAGFWKETTALRAAHRESLKSELKRLEFWFPVKQLLMQLAFLLPILVLFYLWNSRSIKKSNGLQTLISSHLLIIAFVPVFVKIIETVYDIIPKKFIKKLLDFLVSLNLIAVWHYVIIFFAVILFMLLIYIIQKKIFSREKLIQKRISKGQCLECGKKLPAGGRACPFCGFVQTAPCPSCGGQTFVYGSYCRECGAAVARDASV